MIKTLVIKHGEENSAIPDLRYLLTCLLGFAGFLHIDDLFNVKLTYIQIQESHLEIAIPK